MDQRGIFVLVGAVLLAIAVVGGIIEYVRRYRTFLPPTCRHCHRTLVTRTYAVDEEGFEQDWFLTCPDYRGMRPPPQMVAYATCQTTPA